MPQDQENPVTYDDSTGTVTFRIGDADYALRAPLFGEFRKIQELNLARIEADVKAADDATISGLATAVTPDDAPNDETDEQRRARIREQRDAVMATIRTGVEVDAVGAENLGTFWIDAAALLDVTLPPVDNLPVWMLFNPTLVGQVIDHWCRHPFKAPGPPAPPTPTPDPPASP